MIVLIHRDKKSLEKARTGSLSHEIQISSRKSTES